MRCGLALCVGRFQPNRPNLRSLLQPRPRANRRVHQRILCAGPLQPPWSPDPRVCREASQELILQPAGAVAARGGCKGPNKVGLTSDPRMERR